MSESINFLAIDLGASSGRALLGRWDGAHINLEEIHRFPNEPVAIQGHQHWDVLRLWKGIKTGIACYAHQYESTLSGIGVDTWGVDSALQGNQRQWQREGNDYSRDALLALGEQAEPFQSLVDPDAPDFLNPTDMPAAIREFFRRTGQPEPGNVGAMFRCCLESLAMLGMRLMATSRTLNIWKGGLNHEKTV
jgi:sugar (pentulose or hexulose) kinase